MRVFLAGLMTLHAVAHLPGFIVPWKLGQMRGMPYHTTLLAGRLDAGAIGIRAIGLLWLFTALAFGVVAAGALTQREWWVGAAVATALVSLLLSLVELPASWIGIPVNLVIIVTLTLGVRFGWLTLPDPSLLP